MQLVTLGEPKLRNANLRSTEYEITDTIRKIVYKKQKKSYKFEAAWPVEIKK